MTFTQRVQQARTNFAEIAEITRIGMALQHRQITAEQASAAIAQVGTSQQDTRPEGYELVSS